VAQASLDEAWVRELRRALLAWFAAHQRPTPWRNNPDPYRVWVAEVMLQQTQTATVVPYYERFMARFPTVQALADAPLEEVLRYWEGLGYYARARSLHRAAQQIAQNGGQLPATADRLRELPGIGAYTAGAIASIAFGQPTPVVDGNVTRVLARLLWLKGDLKAHAAQKRLWQLAQELVDPQQPGAFNQAVMELGSTVCLPKQPRCGACPVSHLCAAYQRGQPTAVPEPSRRTATQARAWMSPRLSCVRDATYWRGAPPMGYGAGCGSSRAPPATGARASKASPSAPPPNSACRFSPYRPSRAFSTP
jgi:A/G-specific adenine glycosylase